MAKRSVFDVFDRADELGIGYDDVADKDDDEVYRLVFPERFNSEQIFEQPDWGYAHKELGRVGEPQRRELLDLGPGDAIASKMLV